MHTTIVKGKDDKDREIWFIIQGEDPSVDEMRVTIHISLPNGRSLIMADTKFSAEEVQKLKERIMQFQGIHVTPKAVIQHEDHDQDMRNEKYLRDKDRAE